MLTIFEKKLLTFASQTAVLVSLAVLPVSLSAASQADSTHSESKHQYFSVPAQPLDQALLQFAQQAGVQLLFKPSDYRQWSASAVIGTQTKEHALAHLLQGLPVDYKWDGEQRLRLMPSSTHTVTLNPELVVADAQNVVDTREITQTAEDLTRLAVQDERDLVRLTTGVTVVEGGRSGSNGYAIRGVDADRVAITVDGVPQAESFAPDVYQGYGYFNGTRNTTELENIQQVVISKGADSLSVGSGGIGGAVQFRTKNVADFIRPEQNFGLLAKVGYSSKNAEWRRVVRCAKIKAVLCCNTPSAKDISLSTSAVALMAMAQNVNGLILRIQKASRGLLKLNIV